MPIAVPLSPIERRAMARALIRAAERFDAQAADMQERLARRKHGRTALESPEVAAALREVSRKLRLWARACAG